MLKPIRLVVIGLALVGCAASSSDVMSSSVASTTSTVIISTSSNDIQSSEVNSSSDVMSSSVASTTSTVIISTSSNDIQSSEVNSSSIPATSTIVTLNSKWSIAMGGANLTQFYSVSENLTQNLTSTKVIEVQKVFNLDGSFYGYVYEALVDGNGGRNSNRFRVGLANSIYLGFQGVEDREHGNFGDIIINALKNDLKGKAADYANAWEIMITANATVAAGTASETINPIADALESITAHYLSQINVE